MTLTFPPAKGDYSINRITRKRLHNSLVSVDGDAIVQRITGRLYRLSVTRPAERDVFVVLHVDDGFICVDVYFTPFLLSKWYRQAIGNNYNCPPQGTGEPLLIPPSWRTYDRSYRQGSQLYDAYHATKEELKRRGRRRPLRLLADIR